MPTLNTARESLYQAFIDGWAGATPVAFAGEDYESGSTAWVRFSMQNEDSTQNTMGVSGNRYFTRQGRVFVQIFTPINAGLYDADTLAEAARTILEGKTIDGVHIYGVSTREVGPDGQWFFTLVEAPFTYFTLK